MALVEACSAAVGTTIATLAFYPVDLVKTRIQAQVGNAGAKEGPPIRPVDVVRHILTTDGPLGLYRGLLQYLAKDILMVASLFFWRQTLTDLYLKHVNAAPRLAEGLLLGVLGGCVNQCLLLPADRIIVRLQVDPAHPSVLQVAQSIYSEGGAEAFWTGLAPSLLLTGNPAITFTAFDALKQRLATTLQSSPTALSGLQTFWLASVAKTLALLLTYPLIRAKVVMLGRLHQGKLRSEADTSSSLAHRQPRQPGLRYMLRILSEILTKEGLPGLYRGFMAQFWLSILSSGLLLMVKDKITAGVCTLLQTPS